MNWTPCCAIYIIYTNHKLRESFCLTVCAQCKHSRENVRLACVVSVCKFIVAYFCAQPK